MKVDAPTLPLKYSLDGRSNLPQTIEIAITTKGNNLMSYTLQNVFQKEPVLKLAIDTMQLNPDGGFITIGREELLRQIKNTNELFGSHFGSNANAIITLYPDMMSISYAPLEERKIEVFFGGQVDLGEESNRMLLSLEMQPDAVMVYGTITALDSLINTQGLISTENAPLVIGRDSINWHKVALIAPDNIRLVPDSVTIKTKVAPLKYNSITINDIAIRNLPDGYYMRLFPSSISVTFLALDNVDISDISNEIHPYVDVNDIKEGNNKLKVKLPNVPKELQMIQLDPDEVEYLLEQK